MTMKRFFFNLLSLSLIAGLVLTSCEDEFTEEQALEQQRQILEALNNADNANDLAIAQEETQRAIDIAELNAEQQMAFQMYQDSLERLGPIVNYSVTVLAAGSVNTNARTSGEAFAPGATVTVVQGGVSRTETAGDNGVATFGDLRIGQAIVTVSAPDHTTVTYTTNMNTPFAAIDEAEDNVETTIPLFPTTVAAGGTEVSGTVWAKLDATTDAAQAVEGAIVRARLSVDDVLDDYGINVGNTDKGEVISASYTDFTITDTTDANGMYSMVVPNGLDDDGSGIWDNGSSVIEFLPTEADQTLLVEQGDTLAVVSKPMLFDSGGGGHIDTNLPSVYAMISSPEGNAPTGFELGSAARATSISLSILRVTNGGSGYAVDDIFTFATGVDGDEKPSTDYAFVRVTDVDANGRITGWDVDNNGALYVTSPGVPTPANATEITEVGFGQEPGGTGATFELEFVAYYDIFVANGGSGYSFVPNVSYSGQIVGDVGGGSVIVDVADSEIGSGGDGTGSNLGSLLTEGGEIIINGGVIQANEASLNDGDTIRTFTGPFASAPTLNVQSIEQEPATITNLNVNANGEVTSIGWTAGSGYASQPTITFSTVDGLTGSGAAAIATINNGQVTNITITNPGSGYVEEVNSTDDEGVFNAQSDENSNEGFKPGEAITNFNYYYGGGTPLEDL